MKVLMFPLGSNNSFMLLMKEKISEEVEIRSFEKFEPRNLIPYVLDNEIDVVHLQFGHFLYRDSFLKTITKSVIFYISILFLRLIGKRMVWTMHNDRIHEDERLKWDYIHRYILTVFCNSVIVWDENTKLIAQRKFSRFGNYVIVPHGNYLPLLENLEVDSSSFREDLGIDQYEAVYLFAGLIREYKQVDKLIKEFKDNFSSEYCLVIAGNPWNKQIEDEIRKLSQESNIHLDLRYIPEETLIKYYEAADWSIFPYSHIFNSGSIYYSMSIGTPFIAPNMGVISSYADTGNILYHNNKMKDALTESKEVGSKKLEEISKENIEMMKVENSWDSVISDLMEEYN